MPSSFGQWLIVILALALGGAAGWLARGRQPAAAAPSAPIVEDDPVVGLTEVEKVEATTATLDTPRPEATVDHCPAPQATLAQAEDEPVRADAGEGLTTPLAPVTADATRQPADAQDSSGTAGADAPAEASTPAIPAPRAAADDDEPVADDVAELVADDDAEPATTTQPVASTPEPAPVATEPAAATVVAGPAAVAEEAATADDFRRIQGVGPKMAAALQAAGIRTYRQLAELDEAALRDTIRAAGLRAAASLAAWPQQAKVLAGAEADAVRHDPAGADEQG